MRINQEKISFLKQQISEIDPGSNLYLFGSRVDDKLKGGDIDILILSNQRIPLAQLRSIKIAFYKRFGIQKLDLVNRLFSDQDSFKKLILLDSVEL